MVRSHRMSFLLLSCLCVTTSTNLPSLPTNSIDCIQSIANELHRTVDSISAVCLAYVANSFESSVEPPPINAERTVPPRPRQVPNWPCEPIKVDAIVVGSIAAVSVARNGNPVIFHRGEVKHVAIDVIDEHERYNGTTTPIRAKTIVELDVRTGRVLSSCGANQFFLPHGLTIDQHDQYWLTDVGLSQVLMYKRAKDIDSLRPAISIGKPFSNGHTLDVLCQPTSVAVAANGEFYISDGYCNSRVLRYTADGVLQRVYAEQAAQPHSIILPHGVNLLEDLDMMCITDRGDLSIVCPSISGQRPAILIEDELIGNPYFIVVDGPFLYAVNGPSSLSRKKMAPKNMKVQGFTLDTRTQRVIDNWGNFTWPHNLAINQDRTALYLVELKPNSRLVKFDLNYKV